MKTVTVFPALPLEHLRQRFSELFPYLQLEVVSVLSAPELAMAGQTINDLCGQKASLYADANSFLIDGDMPVAELEANFRDCFGLTIQIRRWTGYAWHDTDDTRHWTLNQQNQKGAEATLPGLTSHR